MRKLQVLILVLLCFITLSCQYSTKPVTTSTVIVFTFDDACKSVYEKALPVMARYGYRGTVFVNSGTVGSSRKMTWNDLDSLKIFYNWEIGGHTVHHRDLCSLSYDEAEQEVRNDYNTLVNRSYNPVSFATPFGRCPNNYYPMIAKYYKNIRTVQNIHMRKTINRRLLGAYDVVYDKNPQIPIDDIKQRCAENDNLIILLFHDIDEEPNTEIDYGPHRFEEFVQLIHRLGISVLPLNEALDYLDD